MKTRRKYRTWVAVETRELFDSKRKRMEMCINEEMLGIIGREAAATGMSVEKILMIEIRKSLYLKAKQIIDGTDTV